MDTKQEEKNDSEDPYLKQHLEDFKKWVEKDSSKQTARNYTTVVKGFFEKAEYSEPPIRLDKDNKYYEDISKDIAGIVSSDSMIYGLKKYLDWRTQLSGSLQEETQAEFLKKKLERASSDTKPEKADSKVISTQKVEEIVDEGYDVDDELGLLLQMMYETATRISGMTRLIWKDVHLEEYDQDDVAETDILISGDRSKSKETGKVSISSATLTQLDKMYEERQPEEDDVVFYPEMDRRSLYQKVWRIFRPYRKNITPHSFRHSRLTHMGLKMFKEDDIDYPIIKEQLKKYARHQQTETTEIYIEIVKETVQNEKYDLTKYKTVDWE